MLFTDVINHSFTYIVCLGAMAVVAALLIWFLVVGIRQAKKVGISQKDLTICIRTTLLVSLGPTMSILIPMLAMIKLLGAPWSGLRLSVIGSATMEMSLANMSITGMGALGDPGLPKEALGMIVFCVAFGSMIGMVLNIFFNKKLCSNLDALRSKDSSVLDLYTNGILAAVFAVLGATTLIASSVHCAQYYSALLIYFLVMILVKKTQNKKLREYSFTVALVAGMIAAIIWAAILL